MKTRFLRIVFVLLVFSPIVKGQDLHYSQFFASPLNINPALTGIYNGDMRFIGNYGNQWSSVPVDYMTFSGSADLKFLQEGSDNFFSGGLLFNYDQAGDSRLRLGMLGLAGSYTLQATQEVFFTVGLKLSGGQRAFSLDDLTFDEQYDGAQFDPNRGIGEAFDDLSLFIFDIDAGVNLRWQKSPRTKFDFGLGLFHLNRPIHPFYDNNDIRLPMRLSVHAMGGLELADKLDLLLRGMYQTQSPHSEVVLGAGFLIHLNQNLGKEFALELAGHWRLQDALIPMIRLHYRNLEVGFSYDINNSAFDVATLNRGGPEFSVIYRITKVKPLSNYKVCPLF